jgi:hypothetical protein
MPVTAKLVVELVKAHVVLFRVLMSPPGVAVATRQNGTPPVAETDCEDGVTVIEVTPFSETVILAEPVATPCVAVTVALPAPTPVTRPPGVTVEIV